jgi:hypothetical protein
VSYVAILLLAVCLAGCSLVSVGRPPYNTLEEGRALAARQLSDKYKKEFLFSSEGFDQYGYRAAIVGVDDNPTITAHVMMARDGIEWDNYSGVEFKARAEAPSLAACSSAPEVTSCNVEMDLPMSTQRWDGVSFDDFAKRSPVTNTIDVTYGQGRSNDELADAILPLVNSLYKVPVSSFLRIKVNGQERAGFNLDVHQPPKIDRSRIMDDLRLPPLTSPSTSTS